MTYARRWCLLAWSVAVLLCHTVHTARADFAVVDLRTNVHTTGSLNGLIGWEFTPATTLTVTKLGWYDFGSNGLGTAHDVGLFQVSDQQLLVSSTVPAGSAAPIEGPPVRLFFGALEIGAFRYVDIAPTTLNAGQNYVIAGTIPNYGLDPAADWEPFAGYLLQTAPEVSFVQGRMTFFSPPVLAFPVNTISGIRFGPSFQFTAGTTSIPEPSSLILLSLGLSAWFGIAGAAGW